MYKAISQKTLPKNVSRWVPEILQRVTTISKTEVKIAVLTTVHCTIWLLKMLANRNSALPTAIVS